MQQEKIIETKQCKNCQSKFDITDKDLEFYDKISPTFNKVKYSIPSPTHCPDCRQQRRLAFRNERKLYKRNCDASGKQIISMYSPEKTYKVYDQKIWWGDSWDPLDYGIDFDFNKTFFEQFNYLNGIVPHCSIMNRNSENSDYTNICAFNKDCYLIIESSNNINCMYGYWLQKCENCLDCFFINSCFNCYQIIDSINCNKLYFSKNCENCNNSFIIQNCKNCEFCIGCYGLIGKKYFVFNNFVGEEKFINYLNEFKFNPSSIILQFNNLLLSKPKRYSENYNSQNCIGDYINDSCNCYNCFELKDVNDCKYSIRVLLNSYDCMDVDTVGLNSNNIFESINTAINSTNNIFCIRCWSCNKMIYNFNCDYSSNCFGCIGLRNKQYCILNKQYTKEQYEQLVPKIIEHMKKTGEWGEFFPASISPFGYNETGVQYYFPLDRQTAIEKGYKRQDNEYPINILSGIETLNGKDLPENISQVDESILNKAIICEITGKPFRIIKQELEFYKKHNLPLPRRHPDQRHLDRLAKRNPRKLFNRNCHKCGIEIKTTYSPDKPEIVYCEQCYNKQIYG